MNKTYFFIFSVGPVQSFIAQARKAQDLYLGCRMVSDYCRHAAFAFEREKGEIIFPEVRSDSLTNRFLGTVEIENEEHAKRVGKAVENAVKDRFREEGLMAINAGLGSFGTIQIHVTGMKDQLDNHLETYWAFSPYDEQDYAESYRRAEQVFGMSKYMRTPKQLEYQGNSGFYKMFNKGDFLGETGRKCLVDGERNVKIYRWSEDDRKNKEKKRPHRYWNLLKDKLFLENPEEVVLIGDKEKEDDKDASPFASVFDVPPKFIQDGEGLSAVSFFKRCYVPDGDDWDAMLEKPGLWEKKYKKDTFQDQTINTTFPTTASFALFDVIHEMEKKSTENGEARIRYFNLKNLLRQARPYDYRERFPKYRTEDEELFFEENLTEKYFEKHSFNREKLNDIRKAQQAFQNALPKNEEVKASLKSYFALVAIDIDNLGKHLKKLKSREDHEKLAQKLHDFAEKVENISIIERGLGRSLHAGGDDFLLALNLYGLFAALQEIEEALRQTNEKYKDANLPFLTYSTAIVITHYKAPLTRAVKTVKAELKEVKERFEADNKNGVACSFMAKSGAVTTSYFKQDKLDLLRNLFEHLQAGRLSPKFIFQFAKNMAEMGFHGDTTPEEQENLRKFALWELQRLMARAWADEEAKKEEAENKKKLVLAQLAQGLKPLLAEQVRENGTQLDLDNFLQFLKMAELAAKHTNKWNADI